jgi:hypothetical protein
MSTKFTKIIRFLTREQGFKVKGRVEKQDCKEQWVQKRDASRGLTEQRQVRGGQEWGLRRRNVGQGGEQARKGEGLAVDGQQ